MYRLFLYAQGCVWKLGALLHAPRAASRGRVIFPYSIFGKNHKLFALLENQEIV